MKRLLSCAHSSKLSSLLERAAVISTLNQQLLTHLDVECQKHAQVANYQGGVLTLLVDSGAWATRLRYDTPRLLTLFRQEGLHGLANIKILVRPPAGVAVQKSSKRFPIRAPSEIGEQFALLSTTEVNQDLQEALQRLAISIQKHV